MNGDEADLKRALALSEAEERQRRDDDAARERADFARALAASRRSPTPTSSLQGYDRPTPTNSRPHSPAGLADLLPAFSDRDSAPSGYMPEKSLHHPQGRPALPPGAGAAWDDEMREMEMLALAIRISQEEEEERKRIEESQLGEALRRSETDATIASDSSATSTLAPRIEPSNPGVSSPTSSSDESTALPAAPRSRRSSWIQPPLASSMARQSSASSFDEAGTATAHEPVPPTRPPRPFLLPPAKSPEVEASPAGSALSNEPAHVPSLRPRVAIPLRAPPPKPRRAAPLPPGAAGPTANSPVSSPRLAPFPRFNASGADERWRRDNDGSPQEMPNLTPSSSIRGHGPPFDRDTSGGQPAMGAEAVSLSGALLDRRASQASSLSYTTAPSELHGTSTEDGDDVPLSPLSIRNPDLRAATPSDDSRSSTLSSSTDSMSPRPDYQHDPAWNGLEQSFVPAGAMGMSSYAGRSMSAISELTEPISIAAATEDGASVRGQPSEGSLSRADSFPSTVSIDSEGQDSLGRSPAFAQDRAESGTQQHEDVTDTPRPQAAPFPPRGDSVSIPLEPGSMTMPPDGEASGHSPTIRPMRDSQANLGVPLAEHGDGLRCGYPAECARDLDHVCPADGLSALNSIPETIELASDLPPNHTSWAIEAHSWVALVRALMWYGDTVLCAALEDLSQSPSSRCAATATLEFRSDDEGILVMRLVLTLLPPKDPASHEAVHRELRVQKTPHRSYKGKGKMRAVPAPASTAFLLPDVVHLPARLSSLAIQLYSLRHLASIARATQPSQPLSTKVPSHAEGYAALRELADAIAILAQAAQSRRTTTASTPAGSRSGDDYPQEAATDTGDGPDQNQRLVDRLRSRLRGLKRNRSERPADGESDDLQAVGEHTPRTPNRLVKPPPTGTPGAVHRNRSSSRGRAEEPSAPASRLQVQSVQGRNGDDMRYMPVL